MVTTEKHDNSRVVGLYDSYKLNTRRKHIIYKKQINDETYSALELIA